MRRTSLWILVLALLVGACGSDSGTDPDPTPEPIDPGTLRLQIVSGDRQTGRVGGAPGASLARTPGLTLNELPDGLLPEPLVARITTSSGQRVQMQQVEATVVVTYRVIQPDLPSGDQRHCGASFVDSQIPDAQGEVTTYWEEPTIADHDCRMEVRLVVDGTPRVDTAFISRMEPGEPVSYRGPGTLYLLEGQEWTDTESYVRDSHGNPIPHRLEASGAIETDDGSVVVGVEWGRGTWDLVAGDSVLTSGVAYVYPDLPSMAPWTVELACEAPGASYRDVWVSDTGVLAYAGYIPEAPGQFVAAAGLDPAGAASFGFALYGRRFVIVDGDTIYDTATSDTTLLGGSAEDIHLPYYSAGAVAISPDTTALIWPIGHRTPHPDHAGYPARRLPYLRGEGGATEIQGIPALLPLVSTEPYTWQSTDAVAACYSDGWTDATSGTFTVRGSSQ